MLYIANDRPKNSPASKEFSIKNILTTVILGYSYSLYRMHRIQLNHYDTDNNLFLVLFHPMPMESGLDRNSQNRFTNREEYTYVSLLLYLKVCEMQFRIDCIFILMCFVLIGMLNCENQNSSYDQT